MNKDIISVEIFRATKKCLVESEVVWRNNVAFIKTYNNDWKQTRCYKKKKGMFFWFIKQFHSGINKVSWIITYLCFCGTCVSEELGGLQDLLCVDSRFIIVHFRSDYVDNSGSTASDSPSSAIQTINIFLLKSDDTLIHILQDVVLWGNKTMMQLVVYIFY